MDLMEMLSKEKESAPKKEESSSSDAQAKIQEHVDAIKEICESEGMDAKEAFEACLGEKAEEAGEALEEAADEAVEGEKESDEPKEDDGKEKKKLLAIAFLKKKKDKIV